MVANNTHALIIGGGLGALCLAQGLKRYNIPFTVFERDPSPNHRTQGFRLRITNDGYDALVANLPPSLLDLFRQSTATFKQGFTFLDAETGELVQKQAPTPPSAPGGAGDRQSDRGNPDNVFSADRHVLRSVLMTGLTDNELRFGMEFQEYQLLPSGQVQATFKNGETFVGSVLIGADGTYSRVRNQYIPNATQLLDTDGRAIYGKTPLTEELETTVPPGMLEKTTLITNNSQTTSLFLEPMRFEKGDPNSLAPHLPSVHDYVYWVIIARTKCFQQHEQEDLYLVDPKDLSLRATEGWNARIRELFKKRSTCAYTTVSTMSPDIHAWKSTAQVTLLGDAIHAMTPAGIGANTALKDAGLLVKYFREKGIGLEAITLYEQDMREYASRSIAMSGGAGKKMFNQPAFEDMKAL